MTKITNEILALKIDNVHKEVKDLKPDVKANTKFRQQAGGFVTALVLIGGFIGSLLTWVISYFKGGS